MKVSQGRRLIQLLKRRGMTMFEILQTGISICPWKRIAENLAPDETLFSVKNRAGYNVYRVISSKTGQD